MDDIEQINELAQIDAPYGKKITLNSVSYDNGFNLIRLRIKEGKRFTDMDLDVNTVKELETVFSTWLSKQAT